MPYINELVTKQDRETYELDEVKFPPLFLRPAVFAHWTADRSKEIFLIATRASSEEDRDAMFFCLIYKREKIHFFFTRELVDYDCTYRLRTDFIPEKLENERSQIIKELKEALLAYGFTGSGILSFKSVNFDF